MTCAECKWWRRDMDYDDGTGFCRNEVVVCLPNPMVVGWGSNPVSFRSDFGCIFWESKQTVSDIVIADREERDRQLASGNYR